MGPTLKLVSDLPEMGEEKSTELAKEVESAVTDLSKLQMHPHQDLQLMKLSRIGLPLG